MTAKTVELPRALARELLYALGPESGATVGLTKAAAGVFRGALNKALAAPPPPPENGERWVTVSPEAKPWKPTKPGQVVEGTYLGRLKGAPFTAVVIITDDGTVWYMSGRHLLAQLQNAALPRATRVRVTYAGDAKTRGDHTMRRYELSYRQPEGDPSHWRASARDLGPLLDDPGYLGPGPQEDDPSGGEPDFPWDEQQ